MKNEIGNYAKHAQYWDWSGHARTPDNEYWYNYAKRYGNKVLMPMCAIGEAGAYMAACGMEVTAFDITSEMIAEGKRRFNDVVGLRLFEGDVTDFRFDIPPADFCYCTDFGHIHTLDYIKRAFKCINNHMRGGGGLVIETTLPLKKSYKNSVQTYMPLRQIYPDTKVWKTGGGHYDAKTARQYISQTFYAEDNDGNIESFNHSFYMQSYSRQDWLSAFKESGFEVIGEYNSREVKSWQSGGEGFCIFEAVKNG